MLLSSHVKLHVEVGRIFQFFKTVRFPTAKESWKAGVFVGNLNIWAHACKIAPILGFPHNFLLRQKCCAGPHSCH